MCDKSGPQITNPPAKAGEILYRHLISGWFDPNKPGQPSSQAFRPSKKDENCLSVDRSSLTTAEAAFGLNVARPPVGFGVPAIETWGVSLEEIIAAGRTAWSDPAMAKPADPPHSLGLPANPAHGVIDFEGLGRSLQDDAARKLRDAAIIRGRIYAPPAPAAPPAVGA